MVETPVAFDFVLHFRLLLDYGIRARWTICRSAWPCADRAVSVAVVDVHGHGMPKCSQQLDQISNVLPINEVSIT